MYKASTSTAQKDHRSFRMKRIDTPSATRRSSSTGITDLGIHLQAPFNVSPSETDYRESWLLVRSHFAPAASSAKQRKGLRGPSHPSRGINRR